MNSTCEANEDTRLVNFNRNLKLEFRAQKLSVMQDCWPGSS